MKKLLMMLFLILLSMNAKADDFSAFGEFKGSDRIVAFSEEDKALSGAAGWKSKAFDLGKQAFKDLYFNLTASALYSELTKPVNPGSSYPNSNMTGAGSTMPYSNSRF